MIKKWITKRFIKKYSNLIPEHWEMEQMYSCMVLKHKKTGVIRTINNKEG